MATVPLTLTTAAGGVYPLVSAMMYTPSVGRWLVDCEISADALTSLPVPSGRVTVLYGGTKFTGTVDPNSGGSFGPTGKVRVVAGANGWQKTATAFDLHADNGLSSEGVYQQMARAVGETVVDDDPITLGLDFVYSGIDPAVSVFGDNPWFIDPTGTTYVGARPAATADASLVVRDFDPVHRLITFSCDAPLLPNTKLTDPRFNGQTFTVWNVEQTFDGNGSTGWAWASPNASTLITDDLKAAVLAWTRATRLRVYRYRLISYQGDGPAGPPNRMSLQAVMPQAGMPNLIPLGPWSGAAGASSTIAEGSEVLVVFENGDPTLPRVVSYSLSALPLKATYDATEELDLGPSSAVVNVAGGGSPVARVDDTVVCLFPPLMQIAGTVAGAPFVGVLTITTPAIGIIQTGSPKVNSG